MAVSAAFSIFGCSAASRRSGVMLTRLGREYAAALSRVSGFALANPALRRVSGLSRVSALAPVNPGLSRVSGFVAANPGFVVVAIAGEGIAMDGANPASASVKKRRSVSPFTGGSFGVVDGSAAEVVAGIGGGDGRSCGVGARSGPVAAAVCSFRSEERRVGKSVDFGGWRISRKKEW